MIELILEQKRILYSPILPSLDSIQIQVSMTHRRCVKCFDTLKLGGGLELRT